MAQGAVPVWSKKEAVAARSALHATLTPATTKDVDASALYGRFTCSICLDLVRLPLMTACQHVFCSACIQPYLNPQSQGQLASACLCPNCRKPISERTVKAPDPDSEFARSLQTIRINCPLNSALGCTWSGEYRFGAQHETACGWNLVPCACDLYVRSKDRVEHQRKCPLFSVCRICDNPILKQAMTEHTKECAANRSKVVCQRVFPNDGCKDSFTAQEQDLHRQTCLARRRHCDYQSVGCSFIGTRSELDAHLKSGVSEHLRLAMATCGYQRRMMFADTYRLKPAVDWKEFGLPVDEQDRGACITLRSLSGGISQDWVLRLDDIVDVWDKAAQRWASAVVREFNTHSRITVVIVDDASKLVLSFPDDRDCILPAGTKSADRLTPITRVVSDLASDAAVFSKPVTAPPNSSAALEGFGLAWDRPVPGLYVCADVAPADEYRIGQLVDLFLPLGTAATNGMAGTTAAPGCWVTGYFLRPPKPSQPAKPSQPERAKEVERVAVFRAASPESLNALQPRLTARDAGFTFESGRWGIPQLACTSLASALIAPAFTYVLPFVGSPDRKGHAVHAGYVGQLFWPGMLVWYQSEMALVQRVDTSTEALSVVLHVVRAKASEADDVLVTDYDVVEHIRLPTTDDLPPTVQSLSFHTSSQAQADSAVRHTWWPLMRLAARSHARRFAPPEQTARTRGAGRAGEKSAAVRWLELVKTQFDRSVGAHVGRGNDESALGKAKNCSAKSAVDSGTTAALGLETSFGQQDHSLSSTSSLLFPMSDSPSHSDSRAAEADGGKKKAAKKRAKAEDSDQPEDKPEADAEGSGAEDHDDGGTSDAEGAGSGAEDNDDDGDKPAKKKAGKKKPTPKKAAKKKTPAKRAPRSKSKAKGGEKKKAGKKRKAADSDADSDDDAPKKKRKTARSKSKVKKAKAPYICYFQKHQKEYRQQHPEMKQSDIMKALSDQWQQIKNTDKAKEYIELANQDKLRYEAECAAAGIERKPKKSKSKATTDASGASANTSSNSSTSHEVSESSPSCAAEAVAPPNSSSNSTEPTPVA